MNIDNFVVRTHRRWVQIYSDLGAWHQITPDDAREIGEHLAGLPSAVRDDDEAAKRFDLLILRLQLCVLSHEPGFDRLSGQVRAIADALLELINIPAIHSQQQLLDEVSGDEWWIDVTLPMLELLRRRIRSLVRLVPKYARAILYTDYSDQLGEQVEVTLAGMPVGTNLARFYAQVRAWLNDNPDNIAMQKVRRNRALTADDLGELQRLLIEAGAAQPVDLERATEQSQGLGLFIRSLVGLNRDAATDAFSTFIGGRTLTGAQLDFISVIISYLTEHGVMEVGRLYEAPFTDRAPAGPESLFSGSDIDALVAALDEVRMTANPGVA